ncbi:MAG: nucleotidyltransferase domain-containing protein [Phycisphaerae bacterium]
MKLSDLRIDLDRLAGICRRYHVARLEAFGSFASGEAKEQSDLDMLVTFEPGAAIGLEFVSLQQEIESLFSRPVDLLTRESVERSANKYFRRFALRRTEVLYEHAA